MFAANAFRAAGDNLYKPQPPGIEATQRPARVPAWCLIALLLVYLLRHEYVFATGDQDDFLPYLLHLLDPSVLGNDWLVSMQASGFGVRTLFVWLLYLPAKVIGPYATFAVLYVSSWYFIAGAVYALSWRVSPDQIAATGSVVVVLLLTPKFTLGGNDLAYPLLIPSGPAWALALWGLVLSERGKPVWAALLTGLATWCQPLIGLQLFGVCGLLLLWQRRPMRAVLTFGITYIIVAFAVLLPQILRHWNDVPIDPSLYYILFEYRAPHHYLLTRFDAFRSIAFLGVLVLALACFPLLKRSQRHFPLRVLAVTGLYCLAGYVGTELLESEFVGKLQLFKMTVVTKVVAGAVICHAIRHVLPAFLTRILTPFYTHSRRTLAGVALVGALLVILSPNALGFRVTPVTPESPDHRQLEAWATKHTTNGIVFAVPPSLGGFRSRACRAIVVNVKGFPFDGSHIEAWYERMQAMAPIESEAAGSLGNRLLKMDAAFFALPWDEVLSLSSRYGFDYIVRQASVPGTPDGVAPAFTAGDWSVYRIPRH